MVAISSLDIGDDLAKYVEDSLPWGLQKHLHGRCAELGG